MKRQRIKQIALLTLSSVICITIFSDPQNGTVSRLKALIDWPAQHWGLQRLAKTTQPSVNQKISQPSNALPKGLRVLPVQVIQRNITPYERRVRINAGVSSGVLSNMLVVANTFVVGRVVDVREDSSWIQLVSDPAFRLGVQVEGVNAEAVLKGYGTALMVDRVLASEKLSGRLVTSYGNEPHEPAGLPIGRLSDELEKQTAVGLKSYLLEGPVREEFIPNMEIVLGAR